ncbi:MAG: hypothetical protein ABR915_07630 [Thermoguttaceae bacterium]
MMRSNRWCATWFLGMGLLGLVFFGGLCAAKAAVAAEKDEVTLKYDNGSMGDKRSMTGGGHAVLFQRPGQGEGEWFLDRVEVFGARYGLPQPPDEDFSVYITDPTMARFCVVPRPYSLFERGPEKWTTIALPPVRVPEGFYVCLVFNPTQTKGVYVGIDKSVKESHSRDAVPGSHLEVLKEGEWMVRAHLTQKPKGAVQELLDADQREKKQHEALAAGESRLLRGAKATLLKHDTGVMEQHQSYGGPSAQTVAFDAPAGDQYVYAVSFYGSQYGGRHDADAVCGDVYILDSEGRVVSRTSFPYSLLSYQKAWIEVPTLPTKVTGKFHVALFAHSEQYKGIYVGYDTHTKAPHSFIGQVGREKFTFEPVPKKLDWMVRVKLADRPVYYDAADKGGEQ